MASQKIVDFGLATEDGLDRLTRVGALMGTPEYALPEWIEGKTDPVAWDAYSVGIVLYELLLAHLPPPFQRDGRGSALAQATRVMLAKEESPPLDPGPPAPDALRKLLRALTHADPAERLLPICVQPLTACATSPGPSQERH